MFKTVNSDRTDKKPPCQIGITLRFTYINTPSKAYLSGWSFGLHYVLHI